MGNVSSRSDEPGSLYLKDQTRLTISSLTITNSRRKVLLNVTPGSFPATKVIPKKDAGDDTPVEFVLDPDPSASAPIPSFLLRLNNDDELNFRFTFIIRQSQSGQIASSTVNGVASSRPETLDTRLTGLTFAHASNTKELDNLITREFHANPNLQNNSNVQHVGDFSTDGNPSVQFDWTWKWKPPKSTEDKGGGWRNSCSFLDYDQRANRLNTLASFSFWIHNIPVRMLPSPHLPSPGIELTVPSRNRIPSSHSAKSRMSEPDGPGDWQGPATPPETADGSSQATAPSAFKVDVSCQRPGEDMSAVEDGPLFRATMKALEQKTGNMRTKMKKVLKKAEAAQQAQAACNDAVGAFITSLNEASTSNANAIQPALEHYFEKIARQILQYEQQNTVHLQKLIIDPLSKLYNYDIKQAESKKKDFEDESRDYYAYVGRYLGQRQDSLKEKKRAESDSKYQSKRRNFELKRFDYSSFMQDLHGGRKEQEVLSHLTRYAETQARNYLATAKKVEEMIPQLHALIHEVTEVDKEFKFQRTEREEKRRVLEKSTKKYIEPEPVSNPAPPPVTPGNANNNYTSDSELGRADSTGSQLKGTASNAPTLGSSPGTATLGPPTGKSFTSAPAGAAASPGQGRFKGIRDLEERDTSNASSSDMDSGQLRKEGLLWALSRPGSHIDPKGINKQAWHKFWIVLDQGKLSEYSNWKQKLDLHMDPIDLRMASVREARNAERRFCFEVITPHYKRIYQATSEEDMNNWITAINNALQSAVEGQGLAPAPAAPKNPSSIRRDIGSVLTGKSSSYSGQHGYSNSSNVNSVNRRTTVGARPTYVRTDSNSFDENPSKLLQTIREADQGNSWCADCGSNSKVEWVSINLGIVLCIECSGIHRSLGTHISKVRSLTLDVHSFSNDIVEILLQVGNRVSNMVWESKLDQSLKPAANSTREQRLRFITAKYSERLYIQPLSTTLSRYSNSDDYLLASIKKNDIQGVLYGIALRANVNVTDRSRETHAVFLALAAADPAAPGTSPTLSTSRPAKVIPFPIAELLVQNGAEIPSQKPAIPLSASAQLYVNQRAAKTTTMSSNMGPPASKKQGNDTLGALPTIRSGGATSGDESLSNSTQSASHALAGLDSKERDKLQKRASAGAKLAGKVSSSLGGDR